MKDEIIVNSFRYPDKNVEINLDKTKINKEIILYNNDDIELIENNQDKDKYYINFISKENFDSSIEILILKNINIDLSKNNIQFKSLKKISLKNSILLFPSQNISNEHLDNIIIKGDIENMKINLLNLKENNILKNINEITLKIFPKSSKVNIFHLLNLLNTYLSEIKTSLNIHFKGILSNLDTKKEQLDTHLLSRIKQFYIYSLNKVSKETSQIIKEEIIEKMNNLEELYLNENIECNIDNKLKLIPIIDNCDDIDINYTLYDINKLNKIYLSICEYNKHKSTLILYGEANMTYYNKNNKEFLLNIINNNHKGILYSLSLCNFDLENIDYLNEILKSINSVKKLFLQNLNINQEFIDVLKSKNFFGCYKICIENIMFNDEDIENNFYKLINKYKLCKSLQLISLEDITKYSELLSNDNLENLSLEELYDINYSDLKEILTKRKNKLLKMSFKNMEINSDEDKNNFIEIILDNKNNITN